MAPSINIDVAELAGLIVESILYGIFLVLFVAAMYFTFARRRGIGLNKVMVLSALVLFVLATTQLVADATNIFQAFISRTREERISFLQDVSQPLFILKHTTLILMRLVSDFFVTYRCWIVWNNNIWVVITPIALTLGSGVVGFHTIWSFQHYGRETRAAQEQWLIALSVLSLAANAIATAFTALRIWNTGRRTVAEPPAPSLIPVVVIIIESSALNAAYMIANTITLITGNEGLETMAELGTPLVGCIFMLVIIRVWMNATRGNSLTTNINSTIAFRPGRRPSDEILPEGHSVPSKQMVIHQDAFITRDDVFEMSVRQEGKPSTDFST